MPAGASSDSAKRDFPPGRAAPRLGAIVLAAGMSRRMGATKSLLPLGGRPIVLHVVDRLRTSGIIDRIVVVIGHDAERHRRVLADHDDVTPVYNEHYATGEMLSSVQAGLRAMLDANRDAFFIWPVDQPTVSRSTLCAMREAWLNADRPMLVLPRFRGRRGHPILVSTRGAAEILSLATNDETLKTFVTRHQDDTIEIEVDDSGVVGDIDTPLQYQAAAEAWARSARAGDSQLCRSHSACPTEPTQTATAIDQTIEAAPAASAPPAH